MSKQGRQHLIQLLATYEQSNKYYLIFPWAKTDLHGYWTLICPNPLPEPGDRDATLDWLAEQCQGLADGLTYIHRRFTSSRSSLLYHSESLRPACARAKVQVPDPGQIASIKELFGRHGDIKPQNILWFPCTNGGRGTLKITDFGITAFNQKPLEDYQHGDSFACTHTYAAPESSVTLNQVPLGPIYDIWSLGCVYLEFLAWWFGGWALVEMFAQSRLTPLPSEQRHVKLQQWKFDSYFEIQNEQAVIKKAVSKVSLHTVPPATLPLLAFKLYYLGRPLIPPAQNSLSSSFGATRSATTLSKTS